MASKDYKTMYLLLKNENLELCLELERKEAELSTLRTYLNKTITTIDQLYLLKQETEDNLKDLEDIMDVEIENQRMKYALPKQPL